ncbi:MAG TPA: hypothetical protein VFX06_01575 [Stellaceae bacterium]|nr:hypothetical protein [Stellaceae bacterium]
MASDTTLLTIEFLRWVAMRPRRLADVREAWTSTCPLNCAWEDAVAADMVRHSPDGRVTLTKRGLARLESTAVCNLLDPGGGVS